MIDRKDIKVGLVTACGREIIIIEGDEVCYRTIDIGLVVNDIDFFCNSFSLPEKKKIKLWLFAMNDGRYTSYFYTKDLKQWWNKGEIKMSGVIGTDWIRTNTFIEVEGE